MAVVHKFEARRSRGIVWVCDIESSSKYLNSNESAEALELFLQRFLFLSLIFVEAAGGGFIKWMGDGFLAGLKPPLLAHSESSRAKYSTQRGCLAFTLTLVSLASRLL